MRSRPGVTRAAAYGISALLVGGLVLGIWSLVETPAGNWSQAVEEADLELARRLVAAGEPPDEPRVLGLTPLMRAALRDQSEMVTLLITAGADIEATDPEGLAPIHMAALADAVAGLEALISAGADPGVRSRNGMNALDHAAAVGSTGAIRSLVAHGLDVNGLSQVVTQGHGYPRDRGTTPLGIAARNGRLAAARLLLDLGAGVDAPSASGHTPLQLAIFAGKSAEMIDLLLRHGADPAVVADCVEACSLSSGNTLEWARALKRTELVPLLEEALVSR